MNVTVTVRNAGDRTGTETVKVFARQEASSRVQPHRKLVGFDRLELEPGETADATVSVPAERFGFYRPRDGHVVEPGTYRLFVDDLAATFEFA